MLIAMCLVLGTAIFVLLISYYPSFPDAAETTAKQPSPESPPESETVQTAMMSPQIIDRMRQMAKPDSPPERPQPSPPETPAPLQEQPSDTPRHTYRKKETGLSLDRPGGETAAPGGAEEDRKGVIPELSVDLAGLPPERVAEHFGFMLAVQSYADRALIGRVADGRIEPIPGSDLSRYATRGRSARGVEDEFALRRRIAEAVNRPFDDIGLIYLVPKSIDQVWTAWQKKTLQQAGYAMKEVSRVEARYRTDFSLEALALVLKTGQRIPLKGASS